MKKIMILFLVLLLSGCTITVPSLKNDDNINTPSNNEENNQTPIIPTGPIVETQPQVPNTPVDETSIVGSDNDLLRINIYTNDNSTPTVLGVYHEGYINITEQDNSKVIKNDMTMNIKVRGNSTSAPDKKPYKIKFDKAQSLYGLPEAKDWVLLANYFDKTNIRNYLAYKLANKLDNLDFQPSYIFVDVYLNGNYQGMYMLTEQIEANVGRVDIENNKNSNGISSFLLEADTRAVDEYSGYENKCYFNIGDYNIRMKYPSADDYLQALEQNDTVFKKEYEKNMLWVRTFMSNANNALLSNDYKQIEKYFDVDSFIDYYIVQEFFKNVDVGSNSQYYVIDQNDKEVKIKCGPVWDFDISSGVVDNSVSNIYTTYANTELYVKYVDHFYYMLLNNKSFTEKVKTRYEEIRPLLLETIDEIDILKKDLAKAQNRNINKWVLPKDRTCWIEQYAISKTYYKITDLDGHYKHLYNTLNERLSILDKYYK